MKQKFFASSTPAGYAVHVPTLPGIAQDLQDPMHVVRHEG
jgi:hypothetical protein